MLNKVSAGSAGDIDSSNTICCPSKAKLGEVSVKKYCLTVEPYVMVALTVFANHSSASSGLV